MNPDREELLFQLPLSKPAAKRAAWLDADCDGEAALRPWLDALLAGGHLVGVPDFVEPRTVGGGR